MKGDSQLVIFLIRALVLTALGINLYYRNVQVSGPVVGGMGSA